MKGEGALVWVAIVVIALLVIGVVKNPFSTVPSGNPNGETNLGDCKLKNTDAVTIAFRARNDLNSSLDYVATGTNLTEADDTMIASAGLGTWGTSAFTSATTTASCGKTYNMYFPGTVQVTPAKVMGILADVTPKNIDLLEQRQAYLNFAPYSSGYSNISAGFSTGDFNVSTTAQAYGSGTTNTYIVQVTTSNASAAFQNPDDPTLKTYCMFDMPLAYFSKDSGVVLSGPKVIGTVDVPAWGVANGYDKAYAIQPITSNDGTITWQVKITSDLGNPGSTDDVKMRCVRDSYYLGSNGKMKVGIADDSLTILTMPFSQLFWDIT